MTIDKELPNDYNLMENIWAKAAIDYHLVERVFELLLLRVLGALAQQQIAVARQKFGRFARSVCRLRYSIAIDEFSTCLQRIEFVTYRMKYWLNIVCINKNNNVWRVSTTMTAENKLYELLIPYHLHECNNDCDKWKKVTLSRDSTKPLSLPKACSTKALYLLWMFSTAWTYTFGSYGRQIDKRHNAILIVSSWQLLLPSKTRATRRQMPCQSISNWENLHPLYHALIFRPNTAKLLLLQFYFEIRSKISKRKQQACSIQ